MKSFPSGVEMIYPLETLYKRDTNGKIREWTIEYAGPIGAGIRTISGIKDGKLVTSEWKLSEGKNFGKKNATTAFMQAQKEAEAKWKLNREKEYFANVENIDKYDKFKPMLAHEYAKRHQSEGISQPKLDGIRCIARKDGLFSRAGKELVSVPHIAIELEDFFKDFPNVILDGELYNHELKDDFNKITSLVRKTKPTDEDFVESCFLVQYHIYDLFDPNNPDALFLERFNLAVEPNEVIHIVKTNTCATQEDLDSLYSEYTKDGYEGQMIRNNTPYENKRSKNLLKRKEFITEEFDVVEVLEGAGNWAGYAKHFELKLDEKRTFKSGVRGTQKVLKALLEQEEKPTWVTLRYFEKTPDGVPRFPVVIDWGTGKRTD
jgi:ATP-dependent DNA ligase